MIAPLALTNIAERACNLYIMRKKYYIIYNSFKSHSECITYVLNTRYYDKKRHFLWYVYWLFIYYKTYLITISTSIILLFLDSFGDSSGGGGNGGGGGGGRNQYHYNNDRKSLHRVSFKLNSGGGGKPWKAAIKKLVDDDIDMSDQAVISGGRNRQGFRGGFRGGRGRKDGSRVNSPAPRQNYHQSRKLMPGLSPWYQVMIPYGNQHEKTFLLKTILTSISPDVFIPYYYSVVGNTAIFYVDDFEIAEKLYNTDRKISMPNGYRLAIKVKSGTPQISVDSGLMEKMKLAMANRYNPATRALDLTKFHSDPGL